MLIRHPWQLKTVVFLHWCLIHALLFDNVACHNLSLMSMVVPVVEKNQQLTSERKRRGKNETKNDKNSFCCFLVTKNKKKTSFPNRELFYKTLQLGKLGHVSQSSTLAIVTRKDSLNVYREIC